MTDPKSAGNGQKEPEALPISQAECDNASDPWRQVVLERQGALFVMRRKKESPLHAAKLRFPVETEARSAVLAARWKAEAPDGRGSPTTEALLRLMAQCEAIITRQTGAHADMLTPFELHDAIKLQDECNETLAHMIADIRLAYGLPVSLSEPLA